MTLQGSGQITIDDLRTEFGATSTRGLSDFYRGGAFVPDTPANAGVPTAGQIQLSDFYGADSAPAGGATPLFAYKTSDTTRSFTTTVSDDPHLDVVVAANTWYAFEGFFETNVASTISPPSMSFGFTTPGTPTGLATFNGVVNRSVPSNITSPNGQVASGFVPTYTLIPYHSEFSSVLGVRVAFDAHGFFRTDTAGTFAIRWGPTASTSNGLTMNSGSWIKLWAVE